MSMVKGVKGRQVYLRDESFCEDGRKIKIICWSWAVNICWLPYLMEAGRCKMSETPEDIHGGWESPLCELRGHFLGHWLSAAAMHYEATGNEQVRAKAEEIVEELAACQKDNGGQWGGFDSGKVSVLDRTEEAGMGACSTRFTRHLWVCWICMSGRQ